MSAYIVDKEHIIYMVKAWELDESKWSIQHSIAELADVCTMLYYENARSVGYRYNQRNKRKKFIITPEEYISCQWDCIEWPQVMMSIECYDYQSCEHKGWNNSKAKAWTDDLYRIAGKNVRGNDPKLIWGAPAPMSLLLV